MERNYKIDNIRSILIFCVVVGHLLEIIGFEGLYRSIYIFHMPAFIFISGYCARYDKKKILYNLLYPYLLFQILYLVFQTILSKGSRTLEIQFTTPYWLLWFLWAAVLYHLCIPLLEGRSKKISWVMVVGALVLSLLAGYVDSIGYYLSLSRFFTFLPYFVMGYYCGHGGFSFSWPAKKTAVGILLRFLNIILLISTCYFILKMTGIETRVLYGSYSYGGASYTWIVKLLLFIMALNWIVFFWINVPSKKICGLSVIGRNTFSVFVLHGFLIMLLKKMNIFVFSYKGNLVVALLMAVLFVAVFGNEIVGGFVKRYFTGQWIWKLQKKKEEKST